MAKHHPWDALVLALIAAFKMSTDAIEQLAQAIYEGNVAAAQSAYADAASAAGATLPQDWELPDALTEALATSSIARAEGISATYEAELTGMVNEAAATLEENLSQEAATKALSEETYAWASKRADYKGQQIAEAECGYGADQGTDEFLSDLQNGVLYAILPDGTYEGLAPDDFVVAILPDQSDPDVCASYAGNEYDIGDYGLLPKFPLHPNCIHEKVLLRRRNNQGTLQASFRRH